MKNEKAFLGISAVFVVIILALTVAVHDQRQSIYVNPSSGNKMTTGLTEAFLGGSAWAQEVTDNTLFVSGTSTVSANPDKVTIHFSVETTDDSAKISQQENAQLTSTVRSALIAAGIATDGIETTGYTLSQVREYNPDTRQYEEKGFRTTHSMKVELSDTGRAGEIIDAAVSGGANNINSVSFGLSDSKLSELKLQALEAASGSAREKAAAIADGLGVSVSRVMSVTEGYISSPSVMTRSYAAEDAVMGAAVPTEITAGSVSVSANVNVVFEIA